MGICEVCGKPKTDQNEKMDLTRDAHWATTVCAT